nr:Fe2+-dependent dioxygenase [Gammaproteobacteria bacterium]
ISDWMEQAEWISGAHTAGRNAVHHKSNREMDQQSEQWKKINSLVVSTLYSNSVFQRTALPLKVSAAFVARYTSGQAYGKHIDDPVMGTPGARYRSDIACTVFLSDKSDYDGGELTIHSDFGINTIKLDQGSAVLYPASSLHEIAAVTRGVRTVCVLWVQSLIRDTQKRDILAELGDARDALNLQLPEAKVTHSVDVAYTNLVRLWAEV